MSTPPPPHPRQTLKHTDPPLSPPPLTVSDFLWHFGAHARDGGGNSVSHMITRRGLTPPNPPPSPANLSSSASSAASASATSSKHVRQWGPYSASFPAPHIHPPNRAPLTPPPRQDISHTVDASALPSPPPPPAFNPPHSLLSFTPPQDAVQPSARGARSFCASEASGAPRARNMDPPPPERLPWMNSVSLATAFETVRSSTSRKPTLAICGRPRSVTHSAQNKRKSRVVVGVGGG